MCDTCDTIGFTKEPGCVYPGNDIKTGFGRADYFDECVEMCKTISNCEVATWHAGDEMCRLSYDASYKDCSGWNFSSLNTVGRECSLVAECRNPMEEGSGQGSYTSTYATSTYGSSTYETSTYETSTYETSTYTTSTTSTTTTTKPTTTAASIEVFVSTNISVATTIEYSAELSDTSSSEYATQSKNIKDIFQADLEAVADSSDMTLNSVTVTFTESTSRRKRRATSTDTTITAVYSVTVSPSTDLTQLADIISSSTSTAANSAISNSAGTYMSTSAVPSVSSSAVESSFTITSGTYRM